MKRHYRIVHYDGWYYPEYRYWFWLWTPLPCWGWHCGYPERCHTRREALLAIQHFHSKDQKQVEYLLNEVTK